MNWQNVCVWKDDVLLLNLARSKPILFFSRDYFALLIASLYWFYIEKCHNNIQSRFVRTFTTLFTIFQCKNSNFFSYDRETCGFAVGRNFEKNDDISYTLREGRSVWGIMSKWKRRHWQHRGNSYVLATPATSVIIKVQDELLSCLNLQLYLTIVIKCQGE